MKTSDNRPRTIRRLILGDPRDRQGDRSWTGRSIKALSFIAIIVFLGLWIIAFLFLRNDLSADIAAGVWLNDLSCIIFFGGLAIAVFFGALVGNILRRFFWRSLK
jgi:hypothetical protein